MNRLGRRLGFRLVPRLGQLVVVHGVEDLPLLIVKGGVRAEAELGEEFLLQFDEHSYFG